MADKAGLNQPCPCGSGEKYKRCCGRPDAKPKSSRQRMVLMFLGGFAGSIIFVALLSNAMSNGVPSQAPPPPPQRTPTEVPEGKVWSPEHGHWHDAPASSSPEPRPLAGRLVPQPEGPVPEGKVWSPEHGHWHDAPASSPAPRPLAGRLVPQPEGPVPEGKVWSPEHGHWHDLPDTSAGSGGAATPDSPEEGQP